MTNSHISTVVIEDSKVKIKAFCSNYCDSMSAIRDVQCTKVKTSKISEQSNVKACRKNLLVFVYSSLVLPWPHHASLHAFLQHQGLIDGQRLTSWHLKGLPNLSWESRTAITFPTNRKSEGGILLVSSGETVEYTTKGVTEFNSFTVWICLLWNPLVNQWVFAFDWVSRRVHHLIPMSNGFEDYKMYIKKH